MKMEREEIPLFVLSISHRQAPVEIRKQFSFDREQTRRFLSRMKEEPGVWGSVLVSTCNRTEVYFSGERKAVDAVQELLAGEKAADIRLLRRFFRIYQGQKAAEHLFRVTGGLDSMVLGEDEILGQIRTAYNTAREEQSADYYINALFQRALKSAKRIKTETCLSKSSVSIATLSAAQAVQFREGEKKVLLLGAAGQMGSLIAKNLSGRKDIRLFAAVRRRCPAVLMENAAQIAYGERYSYIDQADIVISATASPHYTITYEACRAAVKTQKHRLFLDIAVPNDIDPDIALLEGAQLRNIDYFQEIASEHMNQKEEGLLQAERLIEKEREEAEKELIFHDFLPSLPGLMECLGDKNARQLFYLMKDYAGARELSMLLSLCRRLADAQREERETDGRDSVI